MLDDVAALRATLTGLIASAAAEEETLLAGADGGDAGSPTNWAAAPTVVHNSEFRDEQVQRLAALRNGTEQPEFPRAEHDSPELYDRLCGHDVTSAIRLARGTSAALIDEVRLCAPEDLLDPSRNAWLQGRHLWLQIIVRGFWHPLGHVGDYYFDRGDGERALALHQHACATTEYLNAPAMARGMARYSLAATQAALGLAEDARASLELAIELNPDLRGHAAAEPVLAAVLPA